MINTLVLLAGGLATRLKPVSETIPKSLMEVAGKPFIEHQLKLIKKNGITKVIICAGKFGDKIQEFTDMNDSIGTDIKYSFDGDKLLGTGGAIKKALNLLEDNFFVMYGDSYLMADFREISDFYLSKQNPGLMTVFKNEGKWDKSNIEFVNGDIIKYDKKWEDKNLNYIDYGLGILSKNAFKDFKDEEVFDLEKVYQDLISKNDLLGFEVKERFYEIGSFEGLEETNKFLSNEQ